MPKKYYIITYGCQMNVHESEKLAGMLERSGYEATEDKSDADIIVLNTCCIRDTAESKILGNLGIVKKLKENKPSLKVVVCGCMTQQKDAAEKLKKRCPFINLIFGTHNIHLFEDYLVESEKKNIIDIWESETEIQENLPVRRSGKLNAWVNIMYGCNNFCTYCIVPYVRGRERSRDPQTVLCEIENLLKQGYKEITLLGQNVNSYGNDFDRKEYGFARLLKEAAELPYKYRLGFMTSHPKDFSEDVVKVVAEHENISKFIHLPVQAGNDRILSLMNRKYTSAQYIEKIKILRKYIPNAGLSTDLMVGFPSETEEEFIDSVKLLETVGFNNVFTFIYSRRSGTKADLMDNQVDYKIKRDRIKRLIAAQFEIGKRLASACIGKEYEVLCEEIKDGKACGKTECGKSVVFDCENENIYGQFVKVIIEKSYNTNLYGRLSEEIK